MVWGPTHSRVTSANDGTKGYILARRTGPYGRPICFAFAGSTSRQDGSSVFLDSSLVAKSLNHHMLLVGHAYPLFYDLRDTLAAAVAKARKGKRGLWPYDRTNSWIDGTDIHGLETDSPIFPKTFRRLVDHDRSGQSFSKFPARLAEERITIVPKVHHTGFDTIVELKSKKLRMTERPEDVVFGTVLV